MKVLRIGTRDSRLALWQAEKVASLLAAFDYKTDLVKVKTDGDKDLVTPLYAMGVQGIFTKTLDAYLLSGRVDVVVHSMKDVPVQLAQGLAQAAVLPRANYHDLLVYKNENFAADFFAAQPDKDLQGIIATGSIRRNAALLHRFPFLKIENLRGNIQTRMQKLQYNNWDAAVFAAAGLERIDERPPNATEISWMLPAPAQGAIMVACRAQDDAIKEMCAKLNDVHTATGVKAERDFLEALLGGCSTPICALAKICNNEIVLKGELYSPDGKNRFAVEKKLPLHQADSIGLMAADAIIRQGAGEVIERIKYSS